MRLRFAPLALVALTSFALVVPAYAEPTATPTPASPTPAETATSAPATPRSTPAASKTVRFQGPTSPMSPVLITVTGATPGEKLYAGAHASFDVADSPGAPGPQADSMTVVVADRSGRATLSLPAPTHSGGWRSSARYILQVDDFAGAFTVPRWSDEHLAKQDVVLTPPTSITAPYRVVLRHLNPRESVRIRTTHCVDAEFTQAAVADASGVIDVRIGPKNARGWLTDDCNYVVGYQRNIDAGGWRTFETQGFLVTADGGKKSTPPTKPAERKGGLAKTGV